MDLTSIIHQLYKTKFVNKVLVYPNIIELKVFFESINYSWEYFTKPSKLNSIDLIITTSAYQQEFFPMLSYSWTMLISDTNEIITAPAISDEYFGRFIKIFDQTQDFDYSILKSLQNQTKLPSKFNIREKYLDLLDRKQIQANPRLEKLLIRKRVRSLSWISPITVLTKPYPCPWKCIFCPNDPKMPKSYIRQEAACQRSLRLDFDAYEQTKDRLLALEAAWHWTEKIELIILGWTFTYYPLNYQKSFIRGILKALNKLPRNSKLSLKNLQNLNSVSYHKMVWLSVEIRPEKASTDQLMNLRTLGVTRVEIWVQSLDDEVLRINQRWHSVNDVITTTSKCKQFGFKILYHMMLGLPWSNPNKDIWTFKQLFEWDKFQPDQLKIYPCLIVKWSQLESIYKEINYQPYWDEQIISLISHIKSTIIPSYVRIARITRDLPATEIVLGSKSSNIREKIQVACPCIRCREIKWKSYNNYQIEIISVWTHEYFIEAKENESCLWLCRLSLLESAMIRELHVFGTPASIHEGTKKTQHTWLWKILLEKSEIIAKNKRYTQISVISAVWTRKYYENLWYKLINTYMVKVL